MANRWGIPIWLESEVRERDRTCVYCQRPFEDRSATAGASWEHIINDIRLVTRENIVLCCRSCNASKGQKALGEWLKSPYCQKRGITKDTLSPIARQALIRSSEIGSAGC